MNGLPVDMSKYIAYIIDALNHDTSVSKLLILLIELKDYLKMGFISADNKTSLA